MTAVFDILHAARLRAVGTRFLRQRPFVVLVGALGNATLVSLSGAPPAQVSMLAIGTGGLVFAFFIEAWVLGRRALSELWLSASLLFTLAGIAFGAHISGGLESPMLPLVFAPVTVGLAAFGTQRGSFLLLAVAALSLALLGLVPAPFAPPGPPYRGYMMAWSTLMALALLRLGVVGLVEAYRAAGRSLDHMRNDLLDEAARRARDSEALGAKVAHEIRNPLTAVKGLVQMLSRHPKDERDARRFEVVLSEVERMEGILSDYLTMARPLTDLAPVVLEPRALADEVAAVIEARAAERGIVVRSSGDAGSIIADPRRLREALLNLAQNAILAMAQGGELFIEVTRDASREQMRISVRDGGEGMPDAVLARAGEAFIEGGREDGTGLGLAHARSVARQHGGELVLESTRGVGAIATLVIPFHPGADRG